MMAKSCAVYFTDSKSRNKRENLGCCCNVTKSFIKFQPVEQTLLMPHPWPSPLPVEACLLGTSVNLCLRAFSGWGSKASSCRANWKYQKVNAPGSSPYQWQKLLVGKHSNFLGPQLGYLWGCSTWSWSGRNESSYGWWTGCECKLFSSVVFPGNTSRGVWSEMEKGR